MCEGMHCPFCGQPIKIEWVKKLKDVLMVRGRCGGPARYCLDVTVVRDEAGMSEIRYSLHNSDPRASNFFQEITNHVDRAIAFAKAEALKEPEPEQLAMANSTPNEFIISTMNFTSTA